MTQARIFPVSIASRMAALALAVVILAASMGDALAISRVNASGLTCRALKDVIARQGAVIVRSRSLHSNITLSDRFVSNVRYCLNGQRLDYKRNVQTRDKRYCPVKSCTEKEDTRPIL